MNDRIFVHLLAKERLLTELRDVFPPENARETNSKGAQRSRVSLFGEEDIWDKEGSHIMEQLCLYLRCPPLQTKRIWTSGPLLSSFLSYKDWLQNLILLFRMIHFMNFIINFWFLPCVIDVSWEDGLIFDSPYHCSSKMFKPNWRPNESNSSSEYY